MRQLTICNAQAGKEFSESFPPFNVGDYLIRHKRRYAESAVTIYSSVKNRKNSRKHHYNAYIEFTGDQKPSVIFSRDGKAGVIEVEGRTRERKISEDILLLASVISGSNWHLKSHQSLTYFPPTSYNTFGNWIFLYNTESLKNALNQAFQCLQKKEWQTQFENGFHLIVLFHISNIFNAEQRFLANVVIWEWLYPHLKNPNGATQNDESENLAEIFDFIFKYFWKDKVKIDLKNCIFQVLRNQLAHSGRLPIDRRAAAQWMKDLPWDVKPQPGLVTVNTYLKFFDILTHYVVMKTLEVDGDKLYPSYFPVQLDGFLSIGKIDLPTR